MHQSILTAGVFVLQSFVLAAPTPITLPASASVQQQIVTLENQIVDLANDFVQSNNASAKSDYASANTQFVALSDEVLSSGFTCPPSTAEGAITELQPALDALNYSQNALMTLSSDLQNSASTPTTIDDDFCNAYAAFKETQYYTDNYVDQSTATVASRATETSVFNATQFANDLVSVERGCEILISALKAGKNEETDFKNLQAYITYYGGAADLGIYSCPNFVTATPDTVRAAIEQVHRVMNQAQKAYTDKISNDGQVIEDFCKVQEHMNVIGTFIAKQ